MDTNPKALGRIEIWSASRPGRYALRRTLTRRINPSRLSQTLIWQHCFFVLLPTVLIAPGSFSTKRSIFHRLLELRTKLALSGSGQPRTLQVVFWNGDGWGDDVREETVASEYNEPPFPLLVLVNVTKCIILLLTCFVHYPKLLLKVYQPRKLWLQNGLINWIFSLCMETWRSSLWFMGFGLSIRTIHIVCYSGTDSGPAAPPRATPILSLFVRAGRLIIYPFIIETHTDNERFGIILLLCDWKVKVFEITKTLF